MLETVAYFAAVEILLRKKIPGMVIHLKVVVTI